MFIVDPDPTFTHTVKVRVPVDGGFVDQSCKATFRVVAAEEAASFNLNEGGESAAFLRRAIVSLGDIAGPDKQPIEYSDTLRDTLLSRTYFRAAIARTYFEAVSGAKAGN